MSLLNLVQTFFEIFKFLLSLIFIAETIENVVTSLLFVILTTIFIIDDVILFIQVNGFTNLGTNIWDISLQLLSVL